MTMQDQVIANPAPHRRVPWNKGKLTGAKPPLRPKHVWSIRTKLQIEGRVRDLAMFNLAIDSKLRGCDVVAIRVEDVAANWARFSTTLSPDHWGVLTPTIYRRFKRTCRQCMMDF
jgi:hypothetical protein